MKPKLHLPVTHPLWGDGLSLLSTLLLTLLPVDVEDYDGTVAPHIAWVAMDKDGDWFGYVRRPGTGSEDFYSIGSGTDYTFLSDQITTDRDWTDTITRVIR